MLEHRSDDREDLHLKAALAPVVRLVPAPTDHLTVLVQPVCPAHEAAQEALGRPPPLAFEPGHVLFDRWHSSRVPLLITQQHQYTFKDPLWKKLQNSLR
jgi:hypothetical protein